MERLTEYHNGVAVIKDKDKHKEAMERLAAYEETGLSPEDIYKIDEAYTQQAKELMEYKNAEEQGLLLWLPYKIGDTVYRINIGAKNPIIEMMITEIRVFKIFKNDHFVVRIDCVGKEDMEESCYLSDSFGRRVFFTRMEAESKLHELKRLHQMTQEEREKFWEE